MVKQMLKKKSKRMPAKKRYKIEKKVREHNRKLRKIQKTEKFKKKNGVSRRLVIVPGDCPFKDKILAEAAALKDNIKQEKLVRRELIKEERKVKKEKKQADKKAGVVAESQQQKPATSGERKVAATFEDLLRKAQERGYQFEKVEQVKSTGDASLKAFYRQFQQVVNDSDVIIEVLDARDPLGTRNPEAEEAVRMQSDKKLLMILNKCDLVPAENIQKWIAYLKQTANAAVLPFKANTQKQKDNLGAVASITDAMNLTETKKTVGISDLMGLLGTWARGEAGGITVGVIGMPNVGKSSLINSLKRCAACNVGAKPGVTRNLQIVHLNSKLRLIDSPGICFSKETGNESMTIEKILDRVPKTTLMLQYGIPDFTDSEEFLANIASKYGQLKKGGIPNTGAAEQKLIHDWHTGAIRFFTEPPVQDESASTSSAIVSSLSKPFSLEDFAPSNEVDMDNAEDSDDDDVTEMETQTQTEDEPNRRVTRSAAKKSVSFAVDDDTTTTLSNKKSAKRQAKPQDAISLLKDKRNWV
ncbi:Guanine nucleotide-binding protein-like 3 [Orchesella cincta]|uniref:Guanine nucleotide-binding protein-like 3 n=1 Tax=Orchesella cincta TaxID=48709 RepID=A0A1D2N463_ORCCI|nr:Guanine nucleotide-binding protein-like 3 [Orchesella cincta]